jgi:replicative DNA helicase
MIDIFASDLRPMQYWDMTVDDKLAMWEKGIPEGRSTGFKHLDTYIRLVNSEFTLIAARPSMGKTSLAMQICENVARDIADAGDDGTVAVFSAEMSGTELYIRMTSAAAGVNAHKLRNGKGTPDEFYQFREAKRRLRTLPIWIDDGSRPTTQTMLERISRLNETNPVRFMLFDFLELGGDSAPKEDIRISTIAQNLKALAKTLNIPVVALSQLSREVETRPSKMPQLSDLRYSGMLEQIADKVLFLMRPEYYIERQMNVSDIPAEDMSGVAYALLAKNRTGPVGMAKLAFIKDRSMFATLERERKDLNDY